MSKPGQVHKYDHMHKSFSKDLKNQLRNNQISSFNSNNNKKNSFSKYNNFNNSKFRERENFLNKPF